MSVVTYATDPLASLGCTRRRFVASAAATAALALPAARAVETAARTANAANALVVVDRASPGAAAFAAAAAACGATVLPFAADPAGVWMRALEPALASRPVAIAGLTRGGAHFALEILAGAYRSRTALRIEHSERGGGFVHRAAGDAAAEVAARLERAGPAWSAEAALALLERVAATPPLSSLEPLEVAPAGQRPPPIYSWLLAPRA